MHFYVFLSLLLSTVSSYQIYTRPSDQYCLAEDENPYLQYSTQTSYQIARNRQPSTLPSCKAEAAWLLIRHGTRYPEPEVDVRLRQLPAFATAVIENHEKRKNGELCEEDLEYLKKWQYKYEPDQLGQLADEGKSDLRILAGGYKLGLPELFSNVTTDRVTVKFTNVPRTQQSAQAFLEGLSKGTFWNLGEGNIDELLMIDKNCTQWDHSASRPEVSSEKNSFEESPEMKDVIHRVSSRLGFTYDIEFRAVKNMYDLCRSEKAVFYKERMPAWCAAFTELDLQILEYYQDLSYYYKSGYGNPMTAKLGCPLIRDMIVKFEDVTKNNGTSDVAPLTLFFAHSITLRSAITKLGLARDSIAPKYNNRPSTVDRQWKTSRISPFTGNVAAVLYRCGSSGDEWKVMFYLNEHPVMYEGCNLGLCDWAYIYGRFRDHVDPETCNTDFCSKENSAPQLPTLVSLIVALTIALKIVQ